MAVKQTFKKFDNLNTFRENGTETGILKRWVMFPKYHDKIFVCGEHTKAGRNNQLITYYQHVSYLLRIHTIPVDTTYNTFKVPT